MSNLEWLCTFIYNNPGAKYNQIMSEFYNWKGLEPGRQRGWCSNYFNTGTLSPGYNGSLWKKIGNKKRTGYVIGVRGLQYVRSEIRPYKMNKNLLNNIKKSV